MHGAWIRRHVALSWARLPRLTMKLACIAVIAESDGLTEFDWVVDI